MKLAAFLLFAAPGSAYAYLDPGAGSLLLQSLIGAIAMGFGVISIYWGRLKSMLKGSKKEEQPERKTKEQA